MGFLRWLVRGFSSKRLAAANRLAVVDAAAVDGSRRLVLIRRDNVEHLLMIGGRADIVVEPNIVRAAAREPALARPPAFAEATEHPATQLAAAPTVFTPPRPQRQSPMAEEPAPQHTEAEPPVPLAPRQSRPVDKLASDQPPRETAPRSAREPHPPGAAAEAVSPPRPSTIPPRRLNGSSRQCCCAAAASPRPEDAEPRSDLTPSPENPIRTLNRRLTPNEGSRAGPVLAP